MTQVRRHLVGFVALVMTLAVGIALGSGPLSRDSLLPSSAPQRAPEVAAADPGPGGDDVAAAAAPGLYGARLEGRTVALISGPGVEVETLDALAAGIEEANGSVSARWTAGRGLVGAGEKTLVDTLGSQLVEQLEGGADPEASTYDRMGQLIGTAIASRKATGAVPGPDAVTIRQSMDAASLLRHDGEEPRLAPLVLFVLGDDLDDSIVEGLVAGLATRAAGVVVTAPEREGDLSAVEALGAVTTVDGVSGETGQLAAVLSLARADDTPGESFGATGADGVLPLG